MGAAVSLTGEPTNAIHCSEVVAFLLLEIAKAHCPDAIKKSAMASDTRESWFRIKSIVEAGRVDGSEGAGSRRDSGLDGASVADINRLHGEC